jgi:hypothetical protein
MTPYHRHMILDTNSPGRGWPPPWRGAPPSLSTPSRSA